MERAHGKGTYGTLKLKRIGKRAAGDGPSGPLQLENSWQEHMARDRKAREVGKKLERAPAKGPIRQSEVEKELERAADKNQKAL